MVYLLLAIALSQASVQRLDIPWRNLVWVAPLGNSGHYAVATRDGNFQPTKVRIWPGKGDSLWFKTDNAINGLSVSRSGKYVLASGLNTPELFQVGRREPVATGLRVGLIDGKPAAIVFDEKSETTFLRIGSRRVSPPKGREFLLMSLEGGWIATERVVYPKDKYTMNVELWRLESGYKLRRERSLGIHWWDGGSTGVPTIFAVAGNEVAMMDIPAGGNALQFPVVIAPGKAPARFYSGTSLEMMTFMDLPVAFGDGLLCQVWIVDRIAAETWDRETTSLMELGDQWLAWFDETKMECWKPPVGFLNVWRESDSSAGYAVRVKGGVEVRRISLPPVGWRKLR